MAGFTGAEGDDGTGSGFGSVGAPQAARQTAIAAVEHFRPARRSTGSNISSHRTEAVMRALGSVAATAAATGVILAPAGFAAAQPVQAGDAQRTIGELEATGYDVVIDRVGSAPINQCIVTSVRNPQTVTETIAVGRGEDRELITVVKSRSITVSLNCER
jgi:hypothetical protein